MRRVKAKDNSIVYWNKKLWSQIFGQIDMSQMFPGYFSQLSNEPEFRLNLGNTKIIFGSLLTTSGVAQSFPDIGLSSNSILVNRV